MVRSNVYPDYIYKYKNKVKFEFNIRNTISKTI